MKRSNRFLRFERGRDSGRLAASFHAHNTSSCLKCSLITFLLQRTSSGRSCFVVLTVHAVSQSAVYRALCQRQSSARDGLRVGHDHNEVCVTKPRAHVWTTLCGFTFCTPPWRRHIDRVCRRSLPLTSTRGSPSPTTTTIKSQIISLVLFMFMSKGTAPALTDSWHKMLVLPNQTTHSNHFYSLLVKQTRTYLTSLT